MSLVLATDHGSTDLWGAILNTALGLVDAHDHTTGKGVQVPSAALKINADVSWSFGGTNFAIIDAKAVDFAPVTAASMASYSSALFSNSSDSNNLYYRNSAGTNVQITSGSTLNISIVGGIGGDYTAVGALLDYDDATDTYRFRQETATAVRQFAKISSANVQLFEYFAAGATPVPTTSVRLASPAALAASYTVTFPAAVPGTVALVQASTAGVLTFTNTTTQNITAADFRFTTAQASMYSGVMWVDPNATHTRLLSAGGCQIGWTIAASPNVLTLPIVIPFACVITGYSVRVNKRTDNTNTIAARLFQTADATTGTETGLGSGVTSAANAPGRISLQELGLSVTVAVGVQYYLRFSPGAGVTPTTDQLLNVELDYTRP